MYVSFVKWHQVKELRRTTSDLLAARNEGSNIGITFLWLENLICAFKVPSAVSAIDGIVVPGDFECKTCKTTWFHI